MDRRLNAEEDALWARVTATVRAFGGRAAGHPSQPIPSLFSGEGRRPGVSSAPPDSQRSGLRRSTSEVLPSRPIGETLDGGWDKRLARGLVAPDRSIDLHGHNLAGAHAALDQALALAIRDGARLLLVVTGRGPKAGDHLPRRGLIRAAIGDWLASSQYASGIAVVRAAHPRHGGAGALYVVLRRRRS